MPCRLLRAWPGLTPVTSRPASVGSDPCHGRRAWPSRGLTPVYGLSSRGGKKPRFRETTGMTSAWSRDRVPHRALGSPSRVRLLEVLREPACSTRASSPWHHPPREYPAAELGTWPGSRPRASCARRLEQSGRRGRRASSSRLPRPRPRRRRRTELRFADALADALLRLNARGPSRWRISSACSTSSASRRSSRTRPTAGPLYSSRAAARCRTRAAGTPPSAAWHSSARARCSQNSAPREEVTALEPFAEPSLCVLSLRRKA